MKKLFATFLVLSFFAIQGWCSPASAHQPRVVQGEQIFISNPEISKAYYGMLSGNPHLYKISSNKDFILYVNVLVPDIEGQQKDVSADIFRDGETIAVLNAGDHEWKKIFEPFGQVLLCIGPPLKSEILNFHLRWQRHRPCYKEIHYLFERLFLQCFWEQMRRQETWVGMVFYS